MYSFYLPSPEMKTLVAQWWKQHCDELLGSVVIAGCMAQTQKLIIAVL